MQPNTKKFFLHFIQLMAAVFLIFFITVSMGKQTGEALLYMNDKDKSKTVLDWTIFWTLGTLLLGIWCIIWVWFKKSEKICTDLFIELFKPIPKPPDRKISGKHAMKSIRKNSPRKSA